MVFDSPHLRLSIEHGTGTLWLGFPGEPVNALDFPRLSELDSSIDAIAASHLRVLVLRSAKPAGFCAGLRPESLGLLPHPTQRANFAWYGQQVFDRLANLDAVSVAFVDGPCLGVGLELALACDYRVCVARPTTHLGFPDKLTCFGGSARLRQLIGRRSTAVIASGNTCSGREAKLLGFVDVACCERRAKIELRTFLDRLESRPVKRWHSELVGFASERAAFSVAALQQSQCYTASGECQTFGLLGDDPHASRIVGEAVLRGGSAVICGNRAAVFAHIDTALRRGFITPLEAEQTRLRVRSSDTLEGFDQAGLVFVAQGHDPFRLASVVRPRTIVCVVRPASSGPVVVQSPIPFPYSRRVIRIGFSEDGGVGLFPSTNTDDNTIATLSAWLKPFGLNPVVFPVAARLLPRAA